MSSEIHSLVLAAGKGTRMKSELPKVVHPILGQPMVAYVVDAVREIGSSDVTLVVGYKSELVKSELEDFKVKFVEQTEQLGTGHAVQCYAKQINDNDRPKNLLVVCGDTPLLSKETLRTMVEIHTSEKPAITMMTLDMKEPGNYGRIVRNNNSVVAIREAKDCSKEELLIKEVNLAVYLFDGEFLFNNIFKLNSNNKQGEFYLTDLIEMASKQNKSVVTCKEKDESSTIGINSRVHLEYASSILKSQILNEHMENGVTIISAEQTLIGPKIKIGQDTTIWPGTTITGKSIIGKDCVIGPNTTIHETVIGNSAIIKNSFLEKVKIEDSFTVPPFSHLSEKVSSY